MLRLEKKRGISNKEQGLSCLCSLGRIMIGILNALFHWFVFVIFCMWVCTSTCLQVCVSLHVRTALSSSCEETTLCYIDRVAMLTTQVSNSITTCVPTWLNLRKDKRWRTHIRINKACLSVQQLCEWVKVEGEPKRIKVTTACQTQTHGPKCQSWTKS